MKIKAKIINALPENKYIAVDEDKTSYTAICSGSIKKTKIYVGDIVILKSEAEVFVIKEILERKNYFIRPPISNIDYMVLCVSLDLPKPDFLLLDKQIIACIKNNVKPIICITKIDLLNNSNSSVLDVIKNVYEKLNIKVWYTSSIIPKSIKEKMEFEPLKFYSFSGNSGVGKSTIVSTLTGNLVETNSVAEKTNRGRHTTKQVKIYELENRAFIVDTPGFSSYDLMNIESKDLKLYYPEFLGNKCKYLDCNHIKEEVNVCDIKEKVNLGVIDKGRYERYKLLYNNLKEKEDFKYKR